MVVKQLSDDFRRQRRGVHCQHVVEVVKLGDEPRDDRRPPNASRGELGGR